MDKFILPLLFLLICLKLVNRWFPLVDKIFRSFFRALKTLLLFCWQGKAKTSGAKKAKPKIYYRQPKP